jgi:hypothetical protein
MMAFLHGEKEKDITCIATRTKKQILRASTPILSVCSSTTHQNGVPPHDVEGKLLHTTHLKKN